MIATEYGEVTQWATNRYRAVGFLLASLTSPNIIEPPDIALVMTPISPVINVSGSAEYVATTRYQFHESVCVVRGKDPRQLALAQSAQVYPEILAKTNVSFVTDEVVVRSSKSALHTILGYQGSGSDIYPPTIYMTLGMIVPEVVVVDQVICVLGDDGKWPKPEPFVWKSNLSLLLIEELVQSINVPSLSLVMTPVAPTVSVSSNTIINVPYVFMRMTPVAPTLTITGAPIVNVLPLNLTMTPVAPAIQVSNFGVNPNPISLTMTPIAPTVTVGTAIQGALNVGRVVTEPKYVAAIELLSPPFNFANHISSGETIIAAQITASVYSGVDPSPSSILSGSAIIDGTKVNQMMRVGVVGCVYELLCSVLTSHNQTLQQTTYFYVEPNLP